jgi:uncharacterized protein with HEPN domain
VRPERPYSDYLEDILEAIEEIVSFVEAMGLDAFLSDRRTNLAVIRALEIIGEAVRHIPEGVRNNHPQVLWQEMMAMRNMLIHQYFGVDLEGLCRTVEEDLPALRDDNRRMLAEMEEEDR